jgi:hypothetical protein
MAKKLNGNMERTPIIAATRKVGGKFKGRIISNVPREVKMKRGNGYVFEFNILDTDFSVEMKDEKTGNYVETNVEEGDRVSVFAPTVLKSALCKADSGAIVTFEYLGKEAGDNGDYHNFSVEQE